MRLTRLVLVIGLVTACIPGIEPPPSVNVGTASETVGRDNTPEFASGPVLRQVRLVVPAGALVDSVEGGFSVGGATSTPEPIPAVEFAVGEPINATVVVDSQGNFREDFVWELPEYCLDWCEVVIPVSIEQTGEGDPPRLGWSASFYVEYDGPVPSEAEEMTAVIEPAG
jgi:hypothetical protein